MKINMDQCSELLKKLNIDKDDDDDPIYEFSEIFKNPNKLPINQVHLKQETINLRKNLKLNELLDENADCFEKTKRYVPALDPSWFPAPPPFFEYHPYSFGLSEDENVQIIPKNYLFLKSLDYLQRCSYHQFWCTILYHENVIAGLHSYLVKPMQADEMNNLNEHFLRVFDEILVCFLQVYKRLLNFKESEFEYMDESVGIEYLLQKKLLNLPIVLSLILLYQDNDLDFINRLVGVYFTKKSAFITKEIELYLNQTRLTLEMIKGNVCGFEPNTVIVPIAVEPRPKVFSLNWLYTITNYLHLTVTTLQCLISNCSDAIDMAHTAELPYAMPHVYENVYTNLYEYLEGRKELEEGGGEHLGRMIFDKIAYGRLAFIDVYNMFITNCIGTVINFIDQPIKQQEIVEMYLHLMNCALEEECFICDYNETYNVAAQNDTFSSCTEYLDSTRSDYIVQCIESLKRYSRLWTTLNGDEVRRSRTRQKYSRHGACTNDASLLLTHPQNGAIEGATAAAGGDGGFTSNLPPKEEILESMIAGVMEMFPHLGDGFVLQCLEAYNYETDQVIGAILEENLPPHLASIPFETIRIPPETDHDQELRRGVVQEYVGKKPQFDDALKLLNVKEKQVNTYILEGIQFTDDYDKYDDEYDDRIDEITPAAANDRGSEDILKYNPNHNEDVDSVSDVSSSEDEEIDKQASNQKLRPGQKMPFCQDPALLRAKREQRLFSRGGRGGARGGGSRGLSGGVSSGTTSKPRDVIGNAKGQGQEKAVLINRQKKEANKSSRANHNRKKGAQFKQSRGMF